MILPDGASIRAHRRRDRARSRAIAARTPRATTCIVLTGYDFISRRRPRNVAHRLRPLKPWDERARRDRQHPVRRSHGSTGAHARSRTRSSFPPPPPIRASARPRLRLGAAGPRRGRAPSDCARCAQQFSRRRAERRDRPITTTLWRSSAAATAGRRPREGEDARHPDRRRVRHAADFLGGCYVNDFTRFGRIYRVLRCRRDAEFRARARRHRPLFVRSAGRRDGAARHAGARDAFGIGPRSLTATTATAAQIQARAAPGYSSGEACGAEELGAQAAGRLRLSNGPGRRSRSSAPATSGGRSMALSLVVVFLFLAALYESWAVPFAVLLAMPFGVLGALIARRLGGSTTTSTPRSAWSTLIGLSAKNAILIVEFAKLHREKGMSAVERGDRGRAPALAADPDDLVRVHPRRAAARLLDRRGRRRAQRSAPAVVGGMLAATLLAIFFVPMFFTRSPTATSPRSARATRSRGSRSTRATGPTPTRCHPHHAAPRSRRTNVDARRSAWRWCWQVCVNPVKYERPAVEVPEAWKQTGPRFAEDGRWWRIYDDSVLDTVVDEALTERKILGRGRARGRSARAGRRGQLVLLAQRRAPGGREPPAGLDAHRELLSGHSARVQQPPRGPQRLLRARSLRAPARQRRGGARGARVERGGARSASVWRSPPRRPSPTSRCARSTSRSISPAAPWRCASRRSSCKGGGCRAG